MFSWAGQPDIVRAAQKDTFYVDILVDQLREVVSLLFGPRRAANSQREVDLIAALTYYSLQIFGRKTLGEEYCDLERVTPSWRIPSSTRMGTLVVLQVVFPYLISKLRRSQSSHRLALRYNEALDLCSMSFSLATVQRLNLAIFYLFGAYLHISHRITGVKYLHTKKLIGPRYGYGMLGALILLQMVISGIISVKAKLHHDKVAEAEQLEKIPCSPGPNCTLCLGPKVAPTATDCGHVYCWDCIAVWCSNKPECPLCRQPVVLSNLVRLCNY
uniref:RING-type E3 ubiquitin transferase n=1 Tax=Spongospora subterranea TaxID=70186 RepID=A0A0H5RQT7_9EUKA|eukprot:CRZ11084.1 hypothetical protein [Spongospora subterranea]